MHRPPRSHCPGGAHCGRSQGRLQETTWALEPLHTCARVYAYVYVYVHVHAYAYMRAIHSSICLFVLIYFYVFPSASTSFTLVYIIIKIDCICIYTYICSYAYIIYICIFLSLSNLRFYSCLCFNSCLSLCMHTHNSLRPNMNQRFPQVPKLNTRDTLFKIIQSNPAPTPAPK